MPVPGMRGLLNEGNEDDIEVDEVHFTGHGNAFRSHAVLAGGNPALHSEQSTIVAG